MRGFGEEQLVAEDLRENYRAEDRDCQILATKDGCSLAAKTFLTGRQVPSQGGELFTVFKSELRFPLLEKVDLAAFFEAGNLWLRVPKGIGPLRTVVGLGGRLVTVFGALAFDVGWNLNPDVVINEPRFVPHFNIGIF